MVNTKALVKTFISNYYRCFCTTPEELYLFYHQTDGQVSWYINDSYIRLPPSSLSDLHSLISTHFSSSQSGGGIRFVLLTSVETQQIQGFKNLQENNNDDEEEAVLISVTGSFIMHAPATMIPFTQTFMLMPHLHHNNRSYWIRNDFLVLHDPSEGRVAVKAKPVVSAVKPSIIAPKPVLPSSSSSSPPTIHEKVEVIEEKHSNDKREEEEEEVVVESSNVEEVKEGEIPRVSSSHRNGNNNYKKKKQPQGVKGEEKKKKEKDFDPDYTVFIRGTAEGVTDKDVIDAFSVFDRVEKVKLVKKGNAKSRASGVVGGGVFTAFVTFENKGVPAKLLKEKTAVLVLGQEMKMDLIREKVTSVPGVNQQQQQQPRVPRSER